MSPSATCEGLGRVRYLPLRFDGANSQASALKLITTLMPEWSSTDSNIEFIRFTDGITNTLLKAVNRRPGLTKAQVDEEAVLLRAYGSGTDILIDREREVSNHELLMRHGLAPELLARFENGMLYRFIPGTPAQMQDLKEPAILKAIARRLAEWHATVPCIFGQPPVHGKQNGMRNGFQNGYGDNEVERTIRNAAPGKPFPNLWTTMQKWIFALPTGTEEERSRQALLQREVEELIEKLSQRPGLGHNGLVFAHCDLLCANVIMHREEDQSATVSFIDYEYATPSPAAFDVANHFAEWAGYDCDYAAVPTVSQRREFIHEYIGTYIQLLPEEERCQLDAAEEERKLMDEVDAFRGVPGFYWGIWSSIQATISDIDFDYATYSELRLGEYWACKAEQDGSRAGQGLQMPLREETWSRDEPSRNGTAGA
ncbi:ethanolamine kinase-like protein [Emericellopsis cladophorae]|uniref:ethanolamine kinase n=1 Tax=Emericellopsis cladophorae TaxID=2686198 RepID=A0A9Q0BHA7_9HYPO|nr:ethanolamine kinase-like protein [Emericellopsis cladophorae]KAI6785867.1 ethanolamine kinase-like protein [Emericellopsis cladophorae]